MDLLTTFHTNEDARKAKVLLEKLGLPSTEIVPGKALQMVAVPALVLSDESHAALGDWKTYNIKSSGWVDYRPSSLAMPEESSPEVVEDIFGVARITMLSPCVADETKIKIIAKVSGNIEPVFPYLNALNRKAALSVDHAAIAFSDDHRTIAIQDNQIAAAKPDNIVDAWLMLERIRRTINDAWTRRKDIEPCYDIRRKPPALEIFKNLPKTNCGLCGELTCMALALRISSGESELELCTPLQEPENAQRREAISEIVSGVR